MEDIAALRNQHKAEVAELRETMAQFDTTEK
jgi:hypothetical protein